MQEILASIIEYAKVIPITELMGLILGLLCVYYLIKESVLTFVFGIAYVIISFFVFWEIQLYGDFILHFFFLVLNIYGWYYWVRGSQGKQEQVQITRTGLNSSIILVIITLVGVFIFGFFLENINYIFQGISPSSLPYWDATTSILSVTGMWLTARKRIDNWYYWLIVDILASIIYLYKGIYFYSFLYLIYIGMAVAGYLAWKKSMNAQTA
jgi:nicotinamide mononucleotide transporter